MRKLTACLIVFILQMAIFTACTEKNPPRDEIPRIKNTLERLSQAIKDRNREAIDSLLIVQALDLGYSSEKILDDVYPMTDSGTFYAFGSKSFMYTKDVGRVDCTIMADSTDRGRPLEITLVKLGEQWYVKRFDLK